MQPGDEITYGVQHPVLYAQPPQSQGPYPQQHFYNASQIPHQVQQHPLNPPGMQTAPRKAKQKYYKPTATETPVLSLFLLSAFIFIAGIEVILRRGIPITADTTIEAVDPEKLLSNPGSLNWGKSADQLGNLTSPYQLDLPYSAMSCIGIEMIVSVSDIERCGIVSSGKSMSL